MSSKFFENQREAIPRWSSSYNRLIALNLEFSGERQHTNHIHHLCFLITEVGCRLRQLNGKNLFYLEIGFAGFLHGEKPKTYSS